MYDHTSNWTSYISIVLCLITLGIVLYNFKGIKTVIASLAIVAGGILLGYAELVSGNVSAYYWGCVVVFLGIWTNGSLQHFATRGMGFVKSAYRKVAVNA